MLFETAIIRYEDDNNMMSLFNDRDKLHRAIFFFFLNNNKKYRKHVTVILNYYS